VWLRERRKAKEPILVVCPTTVISQWLDKIHWHAPGLKAGAYHSGLRDVDAALDAGVLVISYGKERISFAGALFRLAIVHHLPLQDFQYPLDLSCEIGGLGVARER
jgi:hypothetical protein